MPIVRLATPDDVAELAPLVERYWQFEGIGDFCAQGIERLLGELIASPDRGACWVASRDGDLIGYLLVVHVFSLEHGGLMSEIDELFVLPDARSAGLGGRLLREAEQALGRAGLVRLELQLGVTNTRGRSFYARHGYTKRAGFEMLAKPLVRGE